MSQVVSKPVSLLSAEEFFKIPDAEGKQELIEGVVVEMAPPGDENGEAPLFLAVFLGPYLKQTGLGSIRTETGFILRRNPDVVRSPDFAFVSRDALKREPKHNKFRETPPELAVEILSPEERPGEVRGKVLDYLQAGSQEVWVCDPKTHTVVVYLQGGEQHRLMPDDTLTSDLFPGWSCIVEDIFSYLD